MKKGNWRNFFPDTKYSDLLIWINEQISGNYTKEDKENNGALVLKNKISIIIEIFDKD